MYTKFIYTLLYIVVGAGLARSQRSVYDSTRQQSALEDYIVQCYKVFQEQNNQTAEAAKKVAYDISKDHFGPSTSSSLPAPDGSAAAFFLDKSGKSSPEFREYLRWAQVRQVSLAALSVRLGALMASHDGQPLDWAGHTALAGQLSALASEQLAVSMLSANATAEKQSQQKAAVAKYYHSEVEAQRRTDLEHELSEADDL